MRFEDFAGAHGLIVRHVEYGAWKRVPTADHPSKKNGAYRHMGNVAFVQNHATMGEVAVWHPETENEIKLDREAIERRALDAARQIREGHRKAAYKAAAIVKGCAIGQHPYLEAKGLPNASALISEDGALIVPMRDCRTNNILGVQRIALVENEWEKKMLPGMRAKGAVYRFGHLSADELWFVEGYATGLSVAEALRMLRISAGVMVCFSAGNLVHVAAQFSGRHFVFADNDESRAGEKAAWATGLPYAMAPVVGMDANDLHQAEGILSVAKLIMDARRRA